MIKFELFKLDEKDFLVDINKEWISTILEFRKILQRDRGSPGDSQGRKKLQARREFTYIYHMYDYHSKLKNWDENDKHKEALRQSELPQDFVPDDELKAAIEIYKKLKITEAIRSSDSVKGTLVTARKVVDGINLKFQKYLNILEGEMDASEIDTTDEGIISRADKLQKIAESFIKITQDLLSISTKIPVAIESMTKLEEKIAEEMSGEGVLRGGDQRGVRED